MTPRLTLTRTARIAATLAVGGASLGTAVVGGLFAPSADAATAAGVSAQDVLWAQSNAQTDHAEIALGTIVLARSSNAQARQVATMTVSDHQKALAALGPLATEEGIALPTTPNAMQQATAAALQAAPASTFDVTYATDQIQGHELSISQTKTEIADGTSTVIKDYASGSYLPVAESHLTMSEALYTALTSTTAPTSVSAGTGGFAATRSADDAPWIALGAFGAAMTLGAGALGVRRRRQLTV